MDRMPSFRFHNRGIREISSAAERAAEVTDRQARANSGAPLPPFNLFYGVRPIMEPSSYSSSSESSHSEPWECGLLMRGPSSYRGSADISGDEDSFFPERDNFLRSLRRERAKEGPSDTSSDEDYEVRLSKEYCRSTREKAHNYLMTEARYNKELPDTSSDEDSLSAEMSNFPSFLHTEMAEEVSFDTSSDEDSSSAKEESCLCNII
jgi:hypothetical protein